jgi:hypothetical protein
MVQKVKGMKLQERVVKHRHRQGWGRELMSVQCLLLRGLSVEDKQLNACCVLELDRDRAGTSVRSIGEQILQQVAEAMSMDGCLPRLTESCRYIPWSANTQAGHVQAAVC